MTNPNNLISIQIPKKDLEAAAQKLEELQALLEPYLVALTPDERRELPKMSDRNAPFVEKALSYAKTKPELAPAFLKIDEMDIDVKAVSDLVGLFRTVQSICSGLDDTIKLAGSEAWMAALAYYNSAKMGAKMNVPGAKSIYEDLSKRFEKRRRRTEDSVENQA